jgi:hypothetical protein
MHKWCYESGKEYEHGGLSPQECVVPMITVAQLNGAAKSVSIESIIWKGLRCVVKIGGVEPNIRVDLRTRAADATTSIVSMPKAPALDGTVSFLVSDDDREGDPAVITVLAADGTVINQIATIVGG